MYSVEFVLNDYVQLGFDGSPGARDPAVLNCFVWPVVETTNRTWHETDLGYADALRRLTPGTVLTTSESTGAGIRITLDTGSVLINPRSEESFVEIAELRGLRDGSGWFGALARRVSNTLPCPETRRYLSDNRSVLLGDILEAVAEFLLGVARSLRAGRFRRSSPQVIDSVCTDPAMDRPAS